MHKAIDLDVIETLLDHGANWKLLNNKRESFLCGAAERIPVSKFRYFRRNGYLVSSLWGENVKRWEDVAAVNGRYITLKIFANDFRTKVSFNFTDYFQHCYLLCR